MVATPFFGPFDVTRSTNFADNEVINLRPTITEVKDGKSVGALYGTAGLTLLATAGTGPINGMRPLGALLYIVSNNQIYTSTVGYGIALVGMVGGAGGRVSMIDKGTQIAIFTNTGGWVGPAGYPLTGGPIATGGINYAIGDTIVLASTGGSETGAAILTVSNVAAGAVTGYTILQTGSFPTQPTGFVQLSTSGSGSGFTITAPVFGGAQAFMQIALPFAPSGTQTISATYQDGFGLINEPGTQNIWQSIVDDLSVWPPLNNAQADAESDTINAVVQIHRLIYVFKQIGTEVWNDAGVAGFAFQPIPSVMIESGTIAWASVTKVGETLIYLSQNTNGIGIVRQLEGFTSKRISTNAIETLLQKEVTLSDAFAYSYQQEGHQYYVLTLPTSDITLVYDQTESVATGIPIWYKWLAFSNGSFGRHWGNAFCFFNQTLVLGDFFSGNLYKIDLENFTDNGQTRKWIRSWRASQQASMMPRRFTSLQIDMQTGANVPDGTNPQVVLEWSDDGGHNYAQQRLIAAGPPGATAMRVRATRLGSTRRNSGLDRIFRLSSTDPFPVCLIGAELDV